MCRIELTPVQRAAVIKSAMSKSSSCNLIGEAIERYFPDSSVDYNYTYCYPHPRTESDPEQYEYNPNTSHRNVASASTSTGNRKLSAFSLDWILPADKKGFFKISITESDLRNHIVLMTQFPGFEESLASAVALLKVLQRGFDGIHKLEDKLNELSEFQPTVALFAEFVLNLFFENQVVMRPGQNEGLIYNGIFGSVDLLSERDPQTGDAFMMELKIPYGDLHSSTALQAKRQAIGELYANYCSRCRDDESFVGVCVLTDLIAMSAFIFSSDGIYYVPRNTDCGFIILLMVSLYHGFSRDSLRHFLKSLGTASVQELSDNSFVDVDDEAGEDEDHEDGNEEGLEEREEGGRLSRDSKRKYSVSGSNWLRMLKEEQYEEDLRSYNMWDNARFGVPRRLTKAALLQN